MFLGGLSRHTGHAPLVVVSNWKRATISETTSGEVNVESTTHINDGRSEHNDFSWCTAGR